jgi:hypothetical protein
MRILTEEFMISAAINLELESEMRALPSKEAKKEALRSLDQAVKMVSLVKAKVDAAEL